MVGIPVDVQCVATGEVGEERGSLESSIHGRRWRATSRCGERWFSRDVRHPDLRGIRSHRDGALYELVSSRGVPASQGRKSDAGNRGTHRRRGRDHSRPGGRRGDPDQGPQRDAGLLQEAGRDRGGIRRRRILPNRRHGHGWTPMDSSRSRGESRRCSSSVARTSFRGRSRKCSIAHPSVKSSAVIGAPDESRGEVALAFVELVDDAVFDDKSLRSHCREQLAQFKVPREIRCLEGTSAESDRQDRAAERSRPETPGVASV